MLANKKIKQVVTELSFLKTSRKRARLNLVDAYSNNNFMTLVRNLSICIIDMKIRSFTF
jgi:hypothetical protein